MDIKLQYLDVLHFDIYFFFSRIRRVDDIREKSVFSELIGGQRQEENPDAETEIEDETSIDTGLIGDDNQDDVEVIKFIYSEKATQFCEISTNYLTGST